tara:strand:+ start:340 stop:633 length:294 start_codon:yes stop_codon:yes gene_type:complete
VKGTLVTFDKKNQIIFHNFIVINLFNLIFMKQIIVTILLFFITGILATAQVGIGTLSPKAALDISSDKGLLIPRMSDHTNLIPIDGTLDTNEKGLSI